MTQVQSFPVTDQEVELLKATFKGNEALLKSIRSLFFGFDLTDEEKTTIKSLFSNAPLKEAFRKKLFPKLSNEVPIGQCVDFWMGTENQIFGASPDTIQQALLSKQQVNDMLTAAMGLLSDPSGAAMNLSYNAKSIEKDPMGIALMSRNLFIKTVETGLMFVQMTAEQVQKTPAELAMEARKNSTK